MNDKKLRLSYKAVVIGKYPLNESLVVYIRYKQHSKDVCKIYVSKQEYLYESIKKLHIGDEVKADPMVGHEITKCLFCCKFKRIFNKLTYRSNINNLR